MLNNWFRKFYNVLPPDEQNGFIGDGGSGGSGVGANTVFIQPVNLYVDIPTSTGLYVFQLEVNKTGTTYLDYQKEIENGTTLVPAQRTDLSGNNISSSTHTWTNPGVSLPYNLTVKRKFTGVGKQKDSYTTNYDNGSYNYLVLQQAVPVTQFITLDGSGNDDVITSLAPNAVTSVNINTVYKLTKTNSRGKEASSEWTILKTDPAGTYASQPAVAGVDYELTSGTLTSDEIKIKFINNVNFEVKNTCSGYTFSNNPYQTISGDTSANTATSVYYFNLATATVYYDILFPSITPTLTVPANVLVDNDPFSTFAGQQITVNYQINGDGVWVKKSTIGNPDETLTKTESEWLTELTSKCDIVLEVKKETSGEVVISKIGLGPHAFPVKQPGRYNFQYKTTLK